MERLMNHTETLVVTHCWCGVALAIPVSLHEHMKAWGASCYCPVGHTFVYGNTMKKQLAEAKRRLEEERKQRAATLDLLAAEERSHAATRGHLTRAKKRTVEGLCPCCDKPFPDLKQHMKQAHPDYVKLGFA